MTVKVPILAALTLLVGAYAAYPWVTLYRLDRAVRDGDSATLGKLVDWPAVREGVAEDIADVVTDTPDSGVNQLAPFGQGFMRGIAAHAVQQKLTPQTVIARLCGQESGNASLRSAYFTGWSRFIVTFATPSVSTLRLQLDLQDGGWRVTRIEVPAALLRAAVAVPPARIMSAQFHPG
jgi:hypothetical protein